MRELKKSFGKGKNLYLNSSSYTVKYAFQLCPILNILNLFYNINTDFILTKAFKDTGRVAGIKSGIFCFSCNCLIFFKKEAPNE
jgi:hypothetical protein